MPDTTLLFLFLAIWLQNKAPAYNPNKKPNGPVIKIPSSGPWFEEGVKIIGPKKPKIKPAIPRIIPKAMIYAGRLFEILPFFP